MYGPVYIRGEMKQGSCGPQRGQHLQPATGCVHGLPSVPKAKCTVPQKPHVHPKCHPFFPVLVVLTLWPLVCRTEADRDESQTQIPVFVKGVCAAGALKCDPGSLPHAHRISRSRTLCGSPFHSPPGRGTYAPCPRQLPVAGRFWSLVKAGF